MIEKHNYSFEEQTLNIIDNGYKIKSQILLDQIKEVLQLIIKIKEYLQLILENVKIKEITGFINREKNLKYINMTDKRADYNKNIKLSP